MDITFEKIKKKKVLVIGDLMLDRYYEGDVKRISPEAPIPVLVHKNTRDILGGAGNVAFNLLAAGQDVSVASVVGNDEAGNIICAIFKEKGISVDGILMTEHRMSSLKSRYVSGNHQLLRMDSEQIKVLTDFETTYIEKYILTYINKWDAIVLSDYSKGVVSKKLCQHVTAIGKRYNIKVFFDVKENDIEKYKDAYLVKPNKKELEMLYGHSIFTWKELKTAMKELKSLIRCNKLMVTLGSDGMIMLNESEEFLHVNENIKNVYDVVGAGDTALAYVVVSMINGFDDYHSLELANRASSTKVTKFGTVPVSLNEVLGVYKKEKKIKIVEPSFFCNDSWREGKKIVFTNGCFDIVHVGHLSYLEKAKQLGDILIVGVNSDNSIKRIKGKDRPINSQCDRLELLAGFECVDYVVLFYEDTPLNLIKAIKPDVLVKGADYTNKLIVGQDVVEKNGGQVFLVEYVEGKSTTDIIKKVQNNNE